MLREDPLRIPNEWKIASIIAAGKVINVIRRSHIAIKKNERRRTEILTSFPRMSPGCSFDTLFLCACICSVLARGISKAEVKC